jgi:hypothetical protein
LLSLTPFTPTNSISASIKYGSPSSSFSIVMYTNVLINLSSFPDIRAQIKFPHSTTTTCIWQQASLHTRNVWPAAQRSQLLQYLFSADLRCHFNTLQ